MNLIICIVLGLVFMLPFVFWREFVAGMNCGNPNLICWKPAIGSMIGIFLAVIFVNVGLTSTQLCRRDVLVINGLMLFMAAIYVVSSYLT